MTLFCSQNFKFKLTIILRKFTHIVIFIMYTYNVHINIHNVHINVHNVQINVQSTFPRLRKQKLKNLRDKFSSCFKQSM